MALPAIELASKYSKIHDFIVAVQRNYAKVIINQQQKVIKFEYKDSKKSSLFLRKFIDRVIKSRSVSVVEIIKNSGNIRELYNAFNQLNSTVYTTKDNELRYRTNKFISDTIEKCSRSMLELEHILPDSWSINPYSVSDFRLFWNQLHKLSLIHISAFCMSMEKELLHELGPYNTSIIRFSRPDLVKYVKKYTGLKEEVIKEIIYDLTYNSQIPFIDIIQQPLIEIKRNEIFFSPQLVLSSFVDRNFQVLLTRLPHRKKAYDKLKNLKEDTMIKDITQILRDRKYDFAVRKKLKKDNRYITDIDILVYDHSFLDYMIIQLKWFYGADSAQELYNHDIQFNEGIRKTKDAIVFFRNNYEMIASLLNFIPHSSKPKNIYGIIVSKLGTPSPFVEDPDFPVIEEEDFCRIVKRIKANVQILYKNIISFYYSKKKVPDYKESSEELVEGDYKFILPAIEYSAF